MDFLGHKDHSDSKVKGDQLARSETLEIVVAMERRAILERRVLVEIKEL